MSLTENLGRTESKRRSDILIKSETEKKKKIITRNFLTIFLHLELHRRVVNILEK